MLLSTVQVIRRHRLLVQPIESSEEDSIDGNTITPARRIPFGASQMRAALVVTEGGQVFPAQYHHGGGYEIAFIVEGEGSIALEGEANALHTFPCQQGDLVLIPPDRLYAVHNRHANKQLIAWIFFAGETESFWPDGSKAASPARRAPLAQALPAREIFLRHLPPLNLEGCPAPVVNAARATHNRQRLVTELWEVYQGDVQRHMALVEVIQQEVLSALWWCQQTYQESISVIEQMIDEKLQNTC